MSSSNGKKPGDSQFWTSLLNIKNIFYKFVKKEHGEGKNIRFWEDTCVRVRNGPNGPLILGLIRDKGRLLRGQVSLAWVSSKPLYIKRGDVSI